MRQRTRKLVGALVLAPFVMIYALAAMLLAAGLLPGAPFWAAMLYYAVAGLLWVIPAGLLITWMQRPDKVNPG